MFSRHLALNLTVAALLGLLVHERSAEACPQDDGVHEFGSFGFLSFIDPASRRVLQTRGPIASGCTVDLSGDMVQLPTPKVFEKFPELHPDQYVWKTSGDLDADTNAGVRRDMDRLLSESEALRRTKKISEEVDGDDVWLHDSTYFNLVFGREGPQMCSSEIAYSFGNADLNGDGRIGPSDYLLLVILESGGELKSLWPYLRRSIPELSDQSFAGEELSADKLAADVEVLRAFLEKLDSRGELPHPQQVLRRNVSTVLNAIHVNQVATQALPLASRLETAYVSFEEKLRHQLGIIPSHELLPEFEFADDPQTVLDSLVDFAFKMDPRNPNAKWWQQLRSESGGNVPSDVRDLVAKTLVEEMKEFASLSSELQLAKSEWDGKTFGSRPLSFPAEERTGPLPNPGVVREAVNAKLWRLSADELPTNSTGLMYGDLRTKRYGDELALEIPWELYAYGTAELPNPQAHDHYFLSAVTLSERFRQTHLGATDEFAGDRAALAARSPKDLSRVGALTAVKAFGGNDDLLGAIERGNISEIVASFGQEDLEEFDDVVPSYFEDYPQLANWFEEYRYAIESHNQEQAEGLYDRDPEFRARIQASRVLVAEYFGVANDMHEIQGEVNDIQAKVDKRVKETKPAGDREKVDVEAEAKNMATSDSQLADLLARRDQLQVLLETTQRRFGDYVQRVIQNGEDLTAYVEGATKDVIVHPRDVMGFYAGSRAEQELILRSASFADALGLTIAGEQYYEAYRRLSSEFEDFSEFDLDSNGRIDRVDLERFRAVMPLSEASRIEQPSGAEPIEPEEMEIPSDF